MVAGDPPHRLAEVAGLRQVSLRQVSLRDAFVATTKGAATANFSVAQRNDERRGAMSRAQPPLLDELHADSIGQTPFDNA
jgi:hypothetical protein